ncbi:hypothetical protein JQ621_21615 [Bradyrhizobium manausense]|uniref:hypothetical protein n=1 Tax=Bradyrhizobium manausense TaxID=989370 RepID=UPI001BA8CFD4|nr:hypothetical protein [Bradyrhizobium manausense]MBR1090070.1 hypothetical protein [Bradyrhizobium manausense]
MMKSLAPFAIFALLGVSVIVLPGFAPELRAQDAVTSAKADRLVIAVRNCSDQVWPNFEASCLRNGDSNVPVQEARLVTARR